MASRALRRSLIAVVLVVSAVHSRAQVQPIPPFVGGATEKFDLPTLPPSVCLVTRIFGHKADMCTPSGANCVIGTSVVCSCSTCTIQPHGGTQLFSASQGVWEITFDTAALRFGGWYDAFDSNAVTHFRFYDIDDHLVATETPLIPPGCQWTWFGWDLSGGPPIKRVLADTSTHYFILDDLQVDLAPSAPTPYCTAGTTTNGCSAAITASANPKLANSTPCHISVANVEGHKTGVLYYGLSKQLQPWCTGGIGASTLCIKAPILATGPQSSGGTSGQCNGTLALDWSAFQIAHPNALGTPWVAGERVYLQAWFRDPSACRSTNLSNAVALTYQP